MKTKVWEKDYIYRVTDPYWQSDFIILVVDIEDASDIEYPVITRVLHDYKKDASDIYGTRWKLEISSTDEEVVTKIGYKNDHMEYFL